MDEEFVDTMANAVQRHLRASYTIQIQNAHVAYEQVPRDIFNSDFCAVWSEYNDALFECVMLLVRYERSLKAWEKLTPGLDEDVRLTCLADYAHPILRVACDIPLTFKERLAKGTVKLEHLAAGDRTLIERSGNDRRAGYYFKELERLESKEPGLKQIQSCLIKDLYKSPEAEHFKEVHGRTFHDASPSLMSGKVTIFAMSQGAYAIGTENPINLTAELGKLDGIRIRIQRGYELFNERAHVLFNGLAR